MSLITLVDNSRTDKNTSHSYLPVYEKLFFPYREKAKHILEIGIAEGGSIKLWKDYFTQAHIHAVDIYDHSNLPRDLITDRITCHTRTDAYCQDFLNTIDVPLDIVIDDGPHTLQSQIDCIQYYLPKLAHHGLLIIEDIQDFKHCHKLIESIPNIPCTYEIHNLIQNKNRPDDILFILHKI